MISFHNTVDIARPVGQVSAYLADFTHVPEWNYFVQHVTQLTPGPVGVGTRYEQVRRTDRQRYEVVAYEAGRRIAVATLPGERPAFERGFTLHALGAHATRLHDAWRLDTGHPQPLQRVAAGRVRAAVAENLAVLARLLEQGHARLQDGRLVTQR